MLYSLDTFYTSNDWRKFREVFLSERLARDGEFIDEETGERIIDKSKAILHHKIHLTEENVNDVNISLNPQNIELVSERTHEILHNKLNCNGRKVYIAKNIHDVKIQYDLIIDFSRIKRAIGDWNDQKINSNVWAIYNSLIDQVKTRRGQWTTAIVISSTTAIEYNRIKKLLGAEEI